MKCIKCNEDKNEINFSYKNKSLGIIKKSCKNCGKDYRKEYYEKNKIEAKKYSFESTKEIRKRNAQFVWNYLKENPCIECGENDPVVLEFDHRDKEDKILEISQMVLNGNSLKKIKDEIDKCDVLCANCHRRKTAKQFDWYKNIETS